MNPTQAIPDEQQPIHFTTGADTRDGKKELLKHFLEQENIQYQDGVYRNYSKFLYLYGGPQTGKLSFLKEVAEEVFGHHWETKIYLRVDDGQRYPYKLHAHKVESSKKVILVTEKRVHWRKWQELYPTTQTFLFEGVEAESRPHGQMTIQYTDFFQHYRTLRTEFQNNLQTTINNFFQANNLSTSLAGSLYVQIRQQELEFFPRVLGALNAAEITNQQV
jgi:DNA polymerase III delta prime subunit